MLLIRL